MKSDWDNHATSEGPWLLLRDGHAVPLRDLTPEGIKGAAKATVPEPVGGDSPKHRHLLNCIATALGFRGDFGDYTRTHWPVVEAFLAENRCTTRTDFFDDENEHWGRALIGLNESRHVLRRKLADRYFVGPRDRRPGRVFLGIGFDWADLDRRERQGALSPTWLQYRAGTRTLPRGDREAAFDFLLASRTELIRQWGFLDDKLVHGELREVVNFEYFRRETPLEKRAARAGVIRALTVAFRAVVEDAPGWVDILSCPGTDNVAVLRVSGGDHDGKWDVIWRDLRESAPPWHGAPDQFGLAPIDMGPSLSTGETFEHRQYLRRGHEGYWEEREAHEAEQYFYDVGNSVEARRVTDTHWVRQLYLDRNGKGRGL